MSDKISYKCPETFVGRITLLNSFANTILFNVVRTDNIGVSVTEHPYMTAWSMMISGYFWSRCARYLSEETVKPKWIGQSIVNGTLGIANILMLYKIIKARN